MEKGCGQEKTVAQGAGTMSQGRSSIDILSDAIKLQCAGLGGDESLYSMPYPRPGEPVVRNIHVGEYLVVIFRKHDDDVFPISQDSEQFKVLIARAL